MCVTYATAAAASSTKLAGVFEAQTLIAVVLEYVAASSEPASVTPAQDVCAMGSQPLEIHRNARAGCEWYSNLSAS